MVRQIIAGLLISAVPPLASYVLAGGESKGGEHKVVVRAIAGTGQQATEAHGVVNIVGAGDDHDIVWVSADAEDDGGDGKPHMLRVIARTPKGEADPEDAQRGWLGVSIGDVPEAVATQLRTDGKGVLILNVVKDSPADQAGIQAHDVLIQMNGQDVDGEVARAVELIRGNKPGDRVNVVLLRNGETKNATVTLGSRAEMGNTFNWKFESAPAQIEDKVQTRGKIMLRGPGGKWEMKDLGNLAELKDLPPDVLKFVPKSGSRSITVHADGDQKRLNIKVDRDGNSISVEQKDGGTIEVRRTDDNDTETVNSYADAEELRDGDAEAFELYEQADDATVFHVEPGGHGMFNFKLDGDLDLDFDVDEEAMGEVHANLEAHLREAREAYAKSMEEFAKIMEQTKTQNGNVPQHLFGDGGAHFFARPLGKPGHTFEVRPDGTIEVKIRKGDAELIQLFRNEADLAARNPELAEKYRDLMDAGDDQR